MQKVRGGGRREKATLHDPNACGRWYPQMLKATWKEMESLRLNLGSILIKSYCHCYRPKGE